MNLAVAKNLPRPLKSDLRRYFAKEWKGGVAQVDRCDVVLALLRLGTPLARSAAEGMLGKPITVCPPYVIPRVPARAPIEVKAPRITWVASPNPCTGGSRSRYDKVRVGMTLAQLEARGVSKRDVRHWRKQGWLQTEGVEP